MNAREAVRAVLAEASSRVKPRSAEVYAPANIALVKYWGKRDTELNLPVTSSLSLSMGGHGTFAQIEPASAPVLVIDGQTIDPASKMALRMADYLALFGGPFRLTTRSTVPVGAGLASSASAFAAVVAALDDLHGWQMDMRARSILARLGSGSASRSVCTGFVEWRRGHQDDGMDSHAIPLEATWPSIRLGLLKVFDGPKPIGSREAMLRTVQTSPLYKAWPGQVADDLVVVRAAIEAKDMMTLGRAAETNALAMHLSMHAALPSISYWLPESLTAMERVRSLRDEGVRVWFTMDAGPNLKLLFEADSQDKVRAAFPELEVIAPFAT